MTNTLLDAPPITMKSGDEHIIGTDKTLLDFWRWGFSDVLNNTTRGIFAEYLVASALGIEVKPRITWDPYDLTYNGLTIEVKSSAYIQSWKQNSNSSPSFSIRPTREYYIATNTYSTELKRQSDIYIFCLLHHTNRMTINPLEASQWEFYVLPSSILNEKCATQKQISLSTLLKLGAKKTGFKELTSALLRF
jgi:hypothetical protein